MKYLVISCIDRDIKLEATCNTYEEAFAELKEHFIDYQRDQGYSEEDLNTIDEQLELGEDFEFSDCGVTYEDYICAWSNSGRDPYDIKIVDQY